MCMINRVIDQPPKIWAVNKFMTFLFASATLLAAENVSAQFYEGPKEKLHVYLLIGDEVMAGNADLPAGEQPPLDRCYLLNSNNKWEQATLPLNRYSSVDTSDSTMMSGPGLGFAKAMSKADKNISIGLVSNAARGTLVEDWRAKSTYYWGIRGRAKEAMKTGTLKGILWHHAGKSHDVSRLDRIKTLIAYLRTDLRDLELPFVLGEVPGAEAENQVLNSIVESVHQTGLATIDGIAMDKKGFDFANMERFGARYADEMLRLHAGQSAPSRRSLPVIDSHIHASIAEPGGLDIVDTWMKRNNIEKAVVHTLQLSGGSSATMNSETRNIITANFNQYKGKIARFCYIEPDEVKTVEEAVEILEKEKAAGAIGFGEHYGRNMMFDDPRNMRLYAACAKVGFPVMFHIDKNKNMDGRNFPHLRRSLEANPECIFIAHAEWWLQFPDGTCDRMLQEYPNLYAEPSGSAMVAMLNRDRGYTREFLIRNADKVMFGSDAGPWSIRDEGASELQFQLFEQLNLPESVKLKIYRTNAEGVFRFTQD